MRRRMLIGAGIAGAVVVGIGLLVWSSQQGYFGSSGKAKGLLSGAKRAMAQERLPDAQAKLEELISTFPESPWTDDALLILGQVYETQQQHVEAKAMYQTLLERFPSSVLVMETQERLGQANMAVIFSPVVTDSDGMYEVQPGDTLGRIAATYGTTVEFLQRANGIKGDIIYPNQRLKVPHGRFSIIVDKSLNQLLLAQDDEFVRSYSVATGSNNSTPVGTFKIVNRIINPVWYSQGAVVPPDSPENILGTRWLGISAKGYGIHGSVDPEAIGQQVTAGCVRMTNAAVEELFAIVPVGTEVTIVD